MKLALPALLSLLVIGAGTARAADIAVTDAWSRATPGAATTGVVYFTITDSGAPDALTAVSTPIASSASAHESKTVDGVMQMRAVPSVPVDSKAPVTFAPNGYHVMLEGLKQPLKAGDQFPITLTFAHAGAVTTTVAVRALGAGAPDNAMGSMKGMDMSHMNMGHGGN